MVMEKNEAVLEMHPAEVCALKNNVYVYVYLRHNETSYWKKQLKIFGEEDSAIENGGTGTVVFLLYENYCD